MQQTEIGYFIAEFWSPNWSTEVSVLLENGDTKNIFKYIAP